MKWLILSRSVLFSRFNSLWFWLEKLLSKSKSAESRASFFLLLIALSIPLNNFRRSSERSSNSSNVSSSCGGSRYILMIFDCSFLLPFSFLTFTLDLTVVAIMAFWLKSSPQNRLKRRVNLQSGHNRPKLKVGKSRSKREEYKIQTIQTVRGVGGHILYVSLFVFRFSWHWRYQRSKSLVYQLFIGLASQILIVDNTRSKKYIKKSTGLNKPTSSFLPWQHHEENSWFSKE